MATADAVVDQIPVRRQAITVPTLACLLAVDERTVRRAIGRGEIGIVRIGRSVRVAPGEVDRLLGVTVRSASATEVG